MGLAEVACITFFLQVAHGTNDCSQALFPIQESSGKFGYISQTGDIIIPAKYEFASPFNDGTGTLRIDDDSDAIVHSSGKLIKLDGVTLVSNFYKGVAIVMTRDGYGIVDSLGTLKFIREVRLSEDCTRTTNTTFSEGLAGLNTSDGVSFVDTSGNIVFSVASGFSSSGFKNGLTTVTHNNGARSVIRNDGKVVLPPTLPTDRLVSEPSGGLVRLGKHEAKLGDSISWRYLDRAGETVLTVSKEYAGDFSEGLADFMTGGKWGFISITGEIVIQPIFDSVKPFSQGVAVVEKDRRFGFIDSRGDMLFPTHFDSVTETFNCGLAYVRQDDVEGYINKTGRWVWKRTAKK